MADAKTTFEQAVKEAVNQDDPKEMAETMLRRVQEIRRIAYSHGFTAGYHKGFEAGVQAAMPSGIVITDNLV